MQLVAVFRRNKIEDQQDLDNASQAHYLFQHPLEQI